VIDGLEGCDIWGEFTSEISVFSAFSSSDLGRR
jgi:hypothetical protein